ncbi:MAG: hypothetical protein ABSC55_17270, partial [Syntrophorhabdales bacterium]
PNEILKKRYPALRSADDEGRSTSNFPTTLRQLLMSDRVFSKIERSDFGRTQESVGCDRQRESASHGQRDPDFVKFHFSAFSNKLACCDGIFIFYEIASP